AAPWRACRIPRRAAPEEAGAAPQAATGGVTSKHGGQGVSSTRVSRRRMATAIAALRRKMGWTQVEMGKRLGVAGATVSRWESAISIPEPEHLERLADLQPDFRRYIGMPEREHMERSVARAGGIS